MHSLLNAYPNRFFCYYSMAKKAENNNNTDNDSKIVIGLIFKMMLMIAFDGLSLKQFCFICLFVFECKPKSEPKPKRYEAHNNNNKISD